LEIVPPIIPSFLETSRQPHSNSAALPFERNLVILKRRLPRQTSSGSLQRPIWNTFLSIRTNFLQCEFHMMGWDGAARRRCLKNFEGALNRLNGIPRELRNFSLPRIHSSLGILPGLCQGCWRSSEICPAAISSFLSPFPQCIRTHEKFY